MPEVILKLDEKDKESLGTIRCMDGLRAADDGGHIWLRGIGGLESMDIALKQLPVKSTFLTNEKNLLFIPGASTPVDALKELLWLPVSEFITVESPVAAFPGKTSDKINIKLATCGKERVGKALLTSLANWKRYAETAPESRLQALAFAVSENSEVLIMGYPLAPLPGKEYWDAGDILIPAGYDFELSMMPAFISKRLNESKHAVIVFDTAGRWHRIGKECFVPAKRSAIRLTKVNND
jgi:hypothetical protein